jgi:hypothetical protein
MNVSITIEKTTLNMAQARLLERYVASTGCTGAGETEEKEASDEKRTLRDLRHDNEAQEPEMPAMRLGHGSPQTTDATLGLRCLQLHRLRIEVIPLPFLPHQGSWLTLRAVQN